MGTGLIKGLGLFAFDPLKQLLFVRKLPHEAGLSSALWGNYRSLQVLFDVYEGITDMNSRVAIPTILPVIDENEPFDRTVTVGARRSYQRICLLHVDESQFIGRIRI